MSSLEVLHLLRLLKVRESSEPSLTIDSTKGMSVTRTNIDEVVEMLGNAESVIIVPGYGESHPLIIADIRYGRRQSAVCHFRNGPVTQGEGNQLPIRDSPGCWTNARSGKVIWPFQLPS
jgi:hypothetical protein